MPPIYAGTKGISSIIWNPDIKTSTFPTGLILVERIGQCRKASAGTIRNSLAVGSLLNVSNSPAIDGLYVFPAVRESTAEAFTTFDVSAYGRTRDTMREVANEVVYGSASVTVDGVSYATTTRGYKVIQDGVIPANSATPLNVPALPAVVYYYVKIGETEYNGTVASPWTAEAITRTNYGAWDEVVIVWSTTPPRTIILPT